jgi:hypothetical protein
VLVADGQRLELPRDRLWLLDRGEVLVHCGDRPIELWTAPRPLAVTGRAGVGFTAVGPVELIGFDRSRLEPAFAQQLLADENAALWARVELDAQRDDDTFLPWAVPVPGPWWFRRAQAVVMIVQGDPRRIAACMPAAVHPLPGTAGRYALALTRFEDAGSEDPRYSRRFVYHEVTPFVPAWSGLRGPCAFIPELYPDAWMAVILGREIHGFPKRTARIGWREDGGELIVDRKLALRARWRSRAAGDPGEIVGELARALIPHARVADLAKLLVDRLPNRLGFSVVVHKRIGDPRTAGRSFAIDQLVRVPVRLDPIARAERLDGFVAELGDGPGILHGTIIGAWRLETGLRFAAGKRVRAF